MSDGYLDGMQAWITTYHGETQPSKADICEDDGDVLTSLADLKAEPLSLQSGVIWTALNIDYPGHSFSHLGLFFGTSDSLCMPITLLTDCRGPERQTAQPRPDEFGLAHCQVHRRGSCSRIRPYRSQRGSQPAQSAPIVASRAYQAEFRATRICVESTERLQTHELPRHELSLLLGRFGR